MAISLQQFIDNLTRSGLMSAAEVTAFLDGFPPEKRPNDAEALARHLVQDGKLTKYQVNAIHQGKTKGLAFGEYVILDKLGQGGMGVVLKAQHRRMKRTVAVKMLPPAAMKEPEAVRRFFREVEPDWGHTSADPTVHPRESGEDRAFRTRRRPGRQFRLFRILLLFRLRTMIE